MIVAALKFIMVVVFAIFMTALASCDLGERDDNDWPDGGASA